MRIQIRTEYVANKQTVSTKMQEVVLPHTVKQGAKAIAPIQNPQRSTLVLNPPTVTATRKRNQKHSSELINLLVLGSTLSVAMVGTVYLAKPKLFTNITTQFIPHTLPTYELKSPAIVESDLHGELVDYMLKSLAVIDQQGSSND